MPLAVLYIPTPELLCFGGKKTESGMAIVIWLCVPDPDERYAFETIEKTLDYELEDEVVMDGAVLTVTF